MDTRDLSAGAVLYLPVEVPGALLSLGDAHAAQGDGEVCGTAIESPMQVTVKLEVEKGMHLRFPRFSTPGPVSRHFDEKGYEVTTGIGPDLMESARAAVSDMVDLVAAQTRLFTGGSLHAVQCVRRSENQRNCGCNPIGSYHFIFRK